MYTNVGKYPDVFGLVLIYTVVLVDVVAAVMVVVITVVRVCSPIVIAAAAVFAVDVVFVVTVFSRYYWYCRSCCPCVLFLFCLNAVFGVLFIQLGLLSRLRYPPDPFLQCSASLLDP